MVNATYAQSSFLGGAWSKTMQGRTDRPDYKDGMSICINSLPIEQGAWTRRPGFRYGAHTKAGLPARVISYAFQQDAPYTMELTDGWLRFFGGQSLVTSNDQQTVISISAATPANVTTGTHGWTGTGTFVFGNLGTSCPLLQNRQFIGTVTSTTHLTIADAITGAAIDGSTLGTVPVGATISRVMELQTPYVGSSWSSVYSVQADTNAIILNGIFAPRVLSVSTPPTSMAPATFALNAANFLDGPYLDPVANGAHVAPSAVSGLINLTLAFVTWSASLAYSVGDYITYSSVAYKSLLDQNFNHQPDVSSSYWVAVSPSQAVGPNGFAGTDIGRHIRLASEPALWASGSTYAAGATVTYNANTYWTSLTASNTGNIPGVDLVHWAINATAAGWTWGRIIALLNVIAGNVASSANIGNMTLNGGLAGAFNGTQDQARSGSADFQVAGFVSSGQILTAVGYVGKDYSGTVATAYVITSATLFPSTDYGIAYASALAPDVMRYTVNLRAKNTAPANSADGTLLGTFTEATNGTTYSAGTAPVNIVSNDQTTAWKYVWFEITGAYYMGRITTYSVNVDVIASQAVFYTSAGGSTAGAQVEILGNPLVNTSSVRTWRLGLYNGTVGWPTCGTYHEGRLWLSGSVKNRIDGSVPNQTFADSISFAPTEPDGTVTDRNAIDYTLNAPDVNTILWMKPDQQGIVVGTEKGEWLVQATTLNSPLTATSIQAHQVTRIGSSIESAAKPVQTEHTTVFIQRYQRRLMEYFPDIFSGKFSAPNLALTAQHLTSRAMVELAYQQSLSPIIWARCTDGSLLGCSYKRDTLMSSQGPTFAGWHEHVHGGARQIVSIAVGPSADGTLDTLAAVTKDGDNPYFVEFLTNLFQETDSGAGAWQLDSGIVPTVTQNVVLGGVSTMRCTGLWPLNGKTVSVFAGGIDCGDWPVASGVANVPYGGDPAGLFTAAFVAAYVGTLPVVVGFTFTSDGQLLTVSTPQDSGARNGPPFAKKKRIHQAAFLFVNTQGISYGTSFSNMTAANFSTNGGTPYAANALFTGTFRDAVPDEDAGEGYDSMLCWRVKRPYPATIAKAACFISTTDA
jgi:hypothetical protein